MKQGFGTSTTSTSTSFLSTSLCEEHSKLSNLNICSRDSVLRLSNTGVKYYYINCDYCIVFFNDERDLHLSVVWTSDERFDMQVKTIK